MTATIAPTAATSSSQPEDTETPSATPRRRGFGGLRILGSTSPGDFSRLSPRSYFFRSGSETPASTSAPPSLAPTTPQPQIEDRASIAQDSIPDLESGGSERLRPHSQAEESGRDNQSLSTQGSGEETSAMVRSKRTGRRTNASNSVNNQETARPTGARGDDSDVALVTDTNGQANGVAQENGEEKPKTPTIRFFSHSEQRQSRPSLTFAPVVRTLPSESSIIRVGRYSEREGIPISNPAGPSEAPVGFKSKVVSRKHCEFSFLNGTWQIKDVSSSSGTFLNHIRLSQPNTESRLFPVKDGDIVQLGIDFRGGEEMIFRCVKIRIECNRSWQKRPNNFNMNRHAQLQKLGNKESKADDNKGECAICLGEVAPCQSLFIAACAHVWHYKCIRRMLMDSSYPQFTCPNCRAVTDLEAELDIDETGEWEQDLQEFTKQMAAETAQPAPPTTNGVQNQNDTAHVGGAAADYDEPIDLGDIDLTNIHFDNPADQGASESPVITPTSGLLSRRQASVGSASMEMGLTASIEIPRPTNAPQLAHIATREGGPNGRASTPTSTDIISGEGPLTPRNNAGPVVFDGSAGRASGRRLTVTSSQDES